VETKSNVAVGEAAGTSGLPDGALPWISVLGQRLSLLTWAQAVAYIARWADARERRVILLARAAQPGERLMRRRYGNPVQEMGGCSTGNDDETVSAGSLSPHVVSPRSAWIERIASRDEPLDQCARARRRDELRARVRTLAGPGS
jgi:hypothetical protein